MTLAYRTMGDNEYREEDLISQFTPSLATQELISVVYELLAKVKTSL
jgi:hypothetical protein